MIKEIAYDSFGNTTRDTLPQLFFPLGFAGGLVDPHTGFIRFGFRDYDPATGRFTAKDPLGDTGGDHDLYDYCVDDPVSFVDPQGLAAQSVAEQGQPTDTGTREIPGFWKRNAPFWFAHKDEAIRQGIIRAVQGREAESTQAPGKASLWDKNSPGYREKREALIDMMSKELESWGRNMLGGHSIVINSRTRGISDALINKNATKITDAFFQEFMEEAMQSGKIKK